MKRFEPFDTTADVGLRVFGKNIIELFENSALGMFSLIVEPLKGGKEIAKEIEVEGDSYEDILVSMLSDLVFLFETEGFVLRGIVGKMIESKKFAFSLRGVTYSSDRHTLLTHIKAVTFHNLKIVEGRNLRVEIVFDV